MPKKKQVGREIHMKLNYKKLLKKVIIVICAIYFGITVYNQQKVLNKYKKDIIATQKEIDEGTEYKESLVALKENASSLDYIEKIAREKLNMYKPNEKVYIDIGN